MCGPLLTILTFAASAAQSIAGYAAQQADYENKAEAWKQNYINALAAARDDQQQLTLRQTQEEQATGQKVRVSMLEEAQTKAEVDVGSGNVGGISIDNLVRQQGGIAATNRQGLEDSYKMRVTQLQKEKDATNTTALGRINSMQRPVSPSPLSMVAGIATAGVGAYKSYTSSGATVVA